MSLSSSRRLKLAIAIPIFAIALACGTPMPSHYLVQQSSLVPVPIVPVAPAPTGRAALTVGDSTLSFNVPPGGPPKMNSGLWIPRTQVDGAGEIRIVRPFAVRLPFSFAIPDGAIPASPTTAPAPQSVASAFGIGVTARIGGYEDRYTLDFVTDVMAAAIPSTTLVTCLSGPCPGGTSYTFNQYDVTAMLAFGLHGTYRFNDTIRVTGALAVRNQPGNDGTFTIDSVDPPRGHVEFGNWYGVVGANLDVSLTHWLAVVPSVQWPFTASPIEYGPIFALYLRGAVGDDPRPRRRPPPPDYGPAYGYPAPLPPGPTPEPAPVQPTASPLDTERPPEGRSPGI